MSAVTIAVLALLVSTLVATDAVFRHYSNKRWQLKLDEMWGEDRD